MIRNENRVRSSNRLLCSFLIWSVGVAGLLITGCSNQELAKPATATAKPTLEKSSWEFELLDGRRIKPFEDPKTQAIVLVFVATDCPIANAYQPKIAEIHNQFKNRGIQLLLIHPDRETTAAAAKAHAKEFHIETPIVLDTQLNIAKRAGAEVTPEAIVIERDKEVPVYRGAIDNQYAGYGKKRPVANRHYLVEAIENILATEAVAVPKTEPVGCFISWDNFD